MKSQLTGLPPIENALLRRRRPPTKALPAAGVLRELFDADFDRGELRWRPREGGLAARQFNRRSAGKVAGRPDSGGHVQVFVQSSLFYVHRVLWKMAHGEDPPAQIDHINGDRADNRLSNLRLAEHEDNARNRVKHRNNTSGYKGVSFHRKANKWQAMICVNGRNRRLGLFANPEDAHAAYVRAAAQHHGEFLHAG